MDNSDIHDGFTREDTDTTIILFSNEDEKEFYKPKLSLELSNESGSIVGDSPDISGLSPDIDPVMSRNNLVVTTDNEFKLIDIEFFSTSILNDVFLSSLADNIDRYRKIRIDIYDRLADTCEKTDDRRKMYKDLAVSLKAMDITTRDQLMIRLDRCLYDPENGLETLVGRDDIVDYILRLIICLSNNCNTLLQYNGICLLGPSGCGKSKIASVISFCMCQLGILSRHTMITATRTDMAGQYIGHTGVKVRNLLCNSLERVLFIDEAYQLIVKDSSIDYGYEIAAEMVKTMDMHRGLSIIIMAGYEKEMSIMMSANQGMSRRFPKKFILNSYNPDELTIILLNMLYKKADSNLHHLLKDRDVYNILFEEIQCRDFVNGAGDMLDLCDKILFYYDSNYKKMDMKIDFLKSVRYSFYSL